MKIIQLESLYKLKGIGEIDLLIIDEITAINNQISSPTMKRKFNDIILLFEFLIKTSKKIIFSDADIDIRTVEFFNIYSII